MRQTELQLEAELRDSRRLQELSAQLIHEQDVSALYEKIIDAAVAIMRSQFASMQMLYPERGEGGELLLLPFRGFNPQAAKFWEWVRADSESTCGVALRTGQRVIAADVARAASSWPAARTWRPTSDRHPCGADHAAPFARRQAGRHDFHALARAAPAVRARPAPARHPRAPGRRPDRAPAHRTRWPARSAGARTARTCRWSRSPAGARTKTCGARAAASTTT